jgi:hypothetical protein
VSLAQALVRNVGTWPSIPVQPFNLTIWSPGRRKRDPQVAETTRG